MINNSSNNQQRNLIFKCHIHLGIAIIDCKGELQFNSCAQLNQLLTAVYEKNIFHIIINCCHVDNIDSSGIGLFLSWGKKLKNKEGSLYIASLNPHLDKVFRIVKAEKLVVLIKNRADALEEARKNWSVTNGTPSETLSNQEETCKEKLRASRIRLLMAQSHKILLNYNLAIAPPVEKTNILHVSKHNILIEANKTFTPPAGTFVHAMMSNETEAFHFTSSVVFADNNTVKIQFPDEIIEVKEENYFKITQDADITFCCIDSLKKNRIFKGKMLMISGGSIVAEIPRNSDFLGLLGVDFKIGTYRIETCIGRVINVNKLYPKIDVNYNIVITLAFLAIDTIERDKIIKYIFSERKVNK